MEFIFHNLYFTFWFAVSDSDFLQGRYLLSTKQLSQGFKKNLRKISTHCFSYLRTYDRRWYWKLAVGLNLTIVSMMMSSGGRVYYLIFK